MDDVGALYHVMARGFNVGRYPRNFLLLGT